MEKYRQREKGQNRRNPEVAPDPAREEGRESLLQERTEPGLHRPGMSSLLSQSSLIYEERDIKQMLA